MHFVNCLLCNLDNYELHSGSFIDIDIDLLFDSLCLAGLPIHISSHYVCYSYIRPNNSLMRLDSLSLFLSVSLSTVRFD